MGSGVTHLRDDHQLRAEGGEPEAVDAHTVDHDAATSATPPVNEPKQRADERALATARPTYDSDTGPSRDVDVDPPQDQRQVCGIPQANFSQYYCSWRINEKMTWVCCMLVTSKSANQWLTRAVLHAQV